MTKITPQSLVVKHNALIPQLAKLELSELRFLSFCLAHYKSKGGQNRRIKAHVSELSDLFPIDQNAAYKVVKKAMIDIAKKPAEFKIEKKVYLYHWFTGMIYDTHEGSFEFILSPEIEPYLLNLIESGNFTILKLRDVYQFKSATTWKLYENLAQWRSKRSWSVSLDQLRTNLNIIGKYTRWDSLVDRVIKPSLEEINRLSDLTVTFEKEKWGRRVSGVVFFIELKEDEEEGVIVQKSAKERLYLALLRLGIANKTAEKYAEQAEIYGKESIVLKKLPEMHKRAQAYKGPLQKYLLGAIKNEINQQEMEFKNKKEKPNYSESLACYQNYRDIKKETCPQIKAGRPGRLSKCKICFEQVIPIFETELPKRV